MRHKRGNRKLGLPTDQRIALLRSLSRSLVLNDSVVTTDSRAKELTRYIARIVTLGKDGSLHSRRQALKLLPDKDVVKTIFSNVSSRFETRSGGYTRTIKVGFRKGDAAPMTKVEWVD